MMANKALQVTANPLRSLAAPELGRYIQKIKNFVVIRHELTGYNQPEGDAYVERTIRTVKEEEIWLQEYESFSEAKEGISRFIEFYNKERIHSALRYMSPEQYIESLYTRLPQAVNAG